MNQFNLNWIETAQHASKYLFLMNEHQEWMKRVIQFSLVTCMQSIFAMSGVARVYFMRFNWLNVRALLLFFLFFLLSHVLCVLNDFLFDFQLFHCCWTSMLNWLHLCRCVLLLFVYYLHCDSVQQTTGSCFPTMKWSNSGVLYAVNCVYEILVFINNKLTNNRWNILKLRC